MLFIIKFLLSICVIFFANIYASESPAKSYLSTQEKTYSNKNLSVIVHNNFQLAIEAFKQKNYRTAAMHSTGAKEYAAIMGEYDIYKKFKNKLNYIAAKSHIELGSPDLALQSFKKIYDIETELGILSSKTISDSLFEKSAKISSNNKVLTEKLKNQASFFKTQSAIIDQRNYQMSYNQLPADILIDMLEETKKPQDLAINTLKITREPQELEAIINGIENHAKTNNLKALCYLTSIYNTGEYGINKDVNKALNYAYQYVQLLTEQPTTIRPFAHFRIITTLTEHNETNINAYKALHYYNYLQGIINKEPQKSRAALCQLKKIKDQASALKNICIDILSEKYVSSKQAIENWFTIENEKSFQSSLSYFINTESNYILNILENNLATDSTYKEAIHYILGTSYYRLYDYEKAFYHFSQTHLYKTDLPTQCKAFYCFNQSIKALNDNLIRNVRMTQELLLDKKRTSRNKNAITLSHQYINLFAPRILAKLIHYNNYNKALILIESCLKQKPLYQTGINLFEHLLVKTKNKDKSVYKNLMQKFTASGTFKEIKNYAYKNNDLKSWKCLAHNLEFIFKTENVNLTLLNETDLIELEKAMKVFPQIQNEFESLQNIAGDLACYLAEKENDLDKKLALLIKALNWENYESFSTTISLLFKNHIGNKNQVETVINHLEKIALNSPSEITRAETYNFLSKLYLNIEDNQNISFIGLNSKKSFIYAKKAYKLGSQDSCKTLGIFYSQMINIQDEFPVEINYKKAVKYFIKCITSKNKLSILYYYLVPIYEKGDIIQNTIEASKCLQYIIEEQNNIFTEIYEDCIQRLAKIKLKLCCTEECSQNIESLLAELIRDFESINYKIEDEGSLAKLQQNYTINNDTLSKLSPYIYSIINTSHNDYSSAINCFLLGRILYLNKNNTDNGPLCLNISIKCLKRSAYYGMPEAVCLILSNNFIELSHYQKISLVLNSIYLHNNHNSTNQHPIIDRLIQQLPSLYPKNIIDKCSYVIDLFNTNNLDPYLSLDLYSLIDVNENDIFNNNNNNNILNDYTNKKILSEYINLFNASYDNKTLCDKKIINAVILHASFLLCTSDKKNLLTSANYFTKLNKVSKNNSYQMEQMTGIAYYKLSTLESNKLLSEAYLIKSTEFKCPRGIITLTTKWLNNELIKKFCAETIIDLLRKINVVEKKEDVKIFIKKCLKKKAEDEIINLAEKWIKIDKNNKKTSAESIIKLLQSIKTKANNEKIDSLIKQCQEIDNKEIIEKNTKQLLEQLSMKLTSKKPN